MHSGLPTDEVTPDYKPVDIKTEPDFSAARVTGIVLTQEDEIKMRVQVGKVVDAGNNLSGYSRKELALLSGIKSAQFSKIVKGEAWLNIGNLGLWGFATGITPTDVIQFKPLNAPPTLCISWFINGHLHEFDHDEFELFIKLLCRRLGIKYIRANVSGEEPIPNLKDVSWQEMYLDDLYKTVGLRVHQLRNHLQLSEKAFGDILGVSSDTVKRYESGMVRVNRGVFSTYRLFATMNVNPIEITKGSMHHKLRYVQEQRHRALMEIFSHVDYPEFCKIKETVIGLTKV